MLLSLRAGEGALSKQPDEAESAARQPQRGWGGTGDGQPPSDGLGQPGRALGAAATRSPVGRTALPVPPSPGWVPLSPLCPSPAARCFFFCLIRLPSSFEELSVWGKRKGLRNIGCDI